ncbi:hypothetical protein [Desulfosporosinus youngiae]|uniref:Nitrite reductase n=1 Tax=Desulfosporosinus youngiae DSM 17734 TaxID=768710 RepID=H5Y4N4_9FIRM|nr:hypothetical protein [Desulfosporosinus youngiae]EHQ89770.1 hypothetical protein DesyoDRAFT_2715 [Desulfosporosinus youngiae DSM 17734]
MSLGMEDKEKMIKTCQVILESCDKPFVWEEEGTYQYGNYKKPFNLVLPHPQIDHELHNLFESFSGSSYLYDQINTICTLDEEWAESGTYGLDRDFTCYFRRFSLKPEYVEQVKVYFINRLNELQKTN